MNNHRTQAKNLQPGSLHLYFYILFYGGVTHKKTPPPLLSTQRRTEEGINIDPFPPASFFFRGIFFAGNVPVVDAEAEEVTEASVGKAPSLPSSFPALDGIGPNDAVGMGP